MIWSFKEGVDKEEMLLKKRIGNRGKKRIDMIEIEDSVEMDDDSIDDECWELEKEDEMENDCMILNLKKKVFLMEELKGGEEIER